MDEETAQFLEDVDVRVDGLSEDFQSLESVEATPFMEEISLDATRLKNELHDLKGKLLIVRDQMSDEFSHWVDPKTLTEEEFDAKLSTEKIPEGLVQSYLLLKEQMTNLKAKLGEVNKSIFEETKQKIKLPKLIEERSLNELLKI